MAKAKSRTSRRTSSKNGRPSKYSPKYCAQLIAFMARGGKTVVRPMSVSDGEGNGSHISDHPLGKLPAFFEGFARTIDVAVSTLHEWRAAHTEFSEAWEKAKAIQLEQMVQGTMAGIYQPAGAIFALKNMHGWRDRTEIEHSGAIQTGPGIFLPKGKEPSTNGHPDPLPAVIRR